MSFLDPAVAADLVGRIIAGDTNAEAELVERCSPALSFLARRYSRDEDDAQDLHQETLIAALEKIRRQEVREPEKLAAFLRSLAKNLSIQRYRRHRYKVEKSSDAAVDAADAHQPDPLKALLRRERLQRTRRLLADLDVPRDREVLFRYYIAEESGPQICDALELQPDHLYRVLHRARHRYRRLWEEKTEERSAHG